MGTTVITDNKTFSSDRFLSLMKADFAVNKSNYLKLFIGTLGIFAALALLISIIAVLDINSIKHASELTGRLFENDIRSRQLSYGMGYTVASVWIGGILITVFGSLTFSNLSSKKLRITTFMIPASLTEKFILRFLIYFVVGALTLILGFWIGVGIIQLAFSGGSSIVGELYKFIGVELSGTIIAAFILSYFMGNSIYALGSSLWPKLSWIKTWVVIMLIEWLGSLLLIFLSSADISWYSFFTFWGHHISLLKWTGLTTLAVINIACWVFAWVRFRNTQIIQRFMTK